MQNTVLLSMEKIRKVFGPLAALDDVDFSAGKGEIHGLLGENGAGKSTLMNILYGLYQPTGGEIFVEEKKVKIRSPSDSIRLGIGMVHQQSTLVPSFNAIENILIGTEAHQYDLQKVSEKVKSLSENYGMNFPLNIRVEGLEVGVRQKVEIIRALYRNASILILDEPTTFLVEKEFEQLKTSLRMLAERGIAVILITHKIREVFSTCDVATILRKGKVQGTVRIKESDKEKVVKLMFMDQTIEVTDSALPKIAIGPPQRSRKPYVQFINVHTKTSEHSPGLKGINLDIYGGEILGVAGVSGQKDMAEAIVNPETITEGEILVDGKSIMHQSTERVFHLGISYTPEDRMKEAILPTGSITHNVLLPHHAEREFHIGGIFVNWERAIDAARRVMHEFKVTAPDEKAEIRRLSGGNIQKVVLGRALLNPIRLLITHNPSSGLDISTVEFIFKKLVALRDGGCAVLFLNEDLDEIMLISDRVAVCHNGYLLGIRDRTQADKFEIGTMMIEG